MKKKGLLALGLAATMAFTTLALEEVQRVRLRRRQQRKRRKAHKQKAERRQKLPMQKLRNLLPLSLQTMRYWNRDTKSSGQALRKILKRKIRILPLSM